MPKMERLCEKFKIKIIRSKLRKNLDLRARAAVVQSCRARVRRPWGAAGEGETPTHPGLNRLHRTMMTRAVPKSHFESVYLLNTIYAYILI